MAYLTVRESCVDATHSRPGFHIAEPPGVFVVLQVRWWKTNETLHCSFSPGVEYRPSLDDGLMMGADFVRRWH